MAPTKIIHSIKSAGGGDYISFQPWHDAQKRNLVSANQIESAEVYGPNPIGNICDFNTGWTTSPTCYIEDRKSVV